MFGSEEHCLWVCFDTIKGFIYLNIVYCRKQKRLELREDLPVSPVRAHGTGGGGATYQGNTGLCPRLCSHGTDAGTRVTSNPWKGNFSVLLRVTEPKQQIKGRTVWIQWSGLRF